MSKGQRQQHRHAHVNKYAKFSKADGALDRLIAQQEREEKEKEDRERSQAIMSSRSGFGSGCETITRHGLRKEYHHLNSDYIFHIDYS